jgi:hypothetical protein
VTIARDEIGDAGEALLDRRSGAAAATALVAVRHVTGLLDQVTGSG